MVKSDEKFLIGKKGQIISIIADFEYFEYYWRLILGDPP